MNPRRILIFANGDLPDLEAARRVAKPDDVIICADGGARHARALNLIPEVLVGDLDSLEREDAFQQPDAGVTILKHAREKDQTDLELALDHALRRDPPAIVIVGALGGRLDQTLGNISLLSDARLAGRDCCLDDGVEKVVLCRDHAELRGMPGDLVSLLPWGSPATGVRTEGLRWALHGETLFPERSRGISNVMLHEIARIRIDNGLLLIVHRRAGLTPAQA